MLASLILQALLATQNGPAIVHPDRLPRLPGKADLRLWRQVSLGQVAFGRSRPLFVRATTAEGRRALKALGVKADNGVWEPVEWDGGSLLSAMGADGVELKAAPAHKPLLDKSVPEILADLVHAGRGLPASRTGRGVLVGIIDTGVDLFHPAFRRADGKTRIVSVWDQDAAVGPTPDDFGYGRECSRQELQQDICPVADDWGHGTHVAGIVAGGDSLGGVAPGADLAVVRSETFTRLADAVDYLVQLADEREQPLVINISVGGHYGAHDGATPVERYLLRRIGPGRLIVAAAGNDGQARVHLGADLRDEPVRVPIEGLPRSRPVEAIVEMWSGVTDHVEVAIELWVDDDLKASLPLRVSDSELVSGSLTYNGEVMAHACAGIELAMEHHRVRRTVLVDREEAARLPDGGVLALALKGSGRVDAWVSQSDYRYGSARFGASRGPGWVGGDGEHTIAVPATAPGIVAVGAYVVRTRWRDEQAKTTSLDKLAFGILAPYSSMGPTLNPTRTGVKPDITAPGTAIVSARSVSIAPGPDTVDSDRVVMQGTSMAAPHVAGVMALMLEANPELTPAQARSLLARSARSDEFTGEVPNTGWGYGKLDARAAVAQAEEFSGGGCAATPGFASALMGLLLLSRLVRRCRPRRRCQ